MPAYTYTATASAAIHTGAKVIFIDSRKDSTEIEYKSTMCNKGVNFAIFDEKLFECIGTETYDIDSLTYGYSMVE